jgi:hypothetical protein
MKAKPISRDRVKNVLRNLGFRKDVGNGTGHDIWRDNQGRRCHPVLRDKEVSTGNVLALSRELEWFGICEKKVFLQSLRT